jgi:hypothetical protein
MNNAYDFAFFIVLIINNNATTNKVLVFHPVQSSGLHWTADISIMFVIIQSIIQWTPVDSDWTLSPLDFHWTLKSGLQSSLSPVDWTGLDSSGLGIPPATLAWREGHWNPLESTGVHWSPHGLRGGG